MGNKRPPLRSTQTSPSLTTPSKSPLTKSAPESSSSDPPSPKNPLKGKDALLQWAQNAAQGYKDVNITNFTTSWKDGLAFAAIIHYYRPSAIDFKSLKKENARQNLETAFAAAEKIGIAPLLDPEDMLDITVPDMRSVLTYVSSMFQFFKRN
jgi:spectrin beta